MSRLRSLFHASKVLGVRHDITAQRKVIHNFHLSVPEQGQSGKHVDVPVPAVNNQRGLKKMCLMCDGYTENQVRYLINADIYTPGWSVQLVEDPSPAKCFGYTMGLTAKGEPEFLVRGVDLKETHDCSMVLPHPLPRSPGRNDVFPAAGESARLSKVSPWT
ncbi:hypothetical protein CQ018_06575 [Arthrobacter sp. MYb227]|nr:hypothetical protein CQ018_06575 [Arthrobacter sp. MYb227]